MKSSLAGLRIVAWFLLFSVIISGCRKEKPQTNQQGASEVKPPITVKDVSTSSADVNDIAVTVNGTVIRESQVLALIQPTLDVLSRSSSQMPPAMLDGYKKQIRQQAVEQLVATTLLDEKVKEAKIAVTDEQVLSKITEELSALKPPISLEEYKKKLVENSMDFEQQKQLKQRSMCYLKLLEPYWAGKVNVSEDDAKKYYDQNQKQFLNPEQVRASHILVSAKKTDPNETKAKARAKIEALLAKIKAGADFAELARTDSNDIGSAKNGGDLDFFSKGEMVEAFDKVAFELKPGQTSDIVETEYGYHIIKVTDRKDAETVTFDKAKDQLIEGLTQQKESSLAQEYVQSLKEKAKIVYPAGKAP